MPLIASLVRRLPAGPVRIARPVRAGVALLAGLALAASAGLAAAATGPFGVGLPEPAPSGGGFFPSLFGQIALWQSEFYRGLTATVRAMKTDGRAGFYLSALAFAYGVLHAAGPGHGKAIVSAYVLANRETARNGAILAMVSALAQAVTAVALVAIAAVVLGATSIAMTRATEVFEIGSYALVTALGAWLVWRKIILPLQAAFADRYAPVTVTAGGRRGDGGHGHAAAALASVQAHHDHPHGHGHHHHDHAHGHDHPHGHAHHHHHHHGHHDHGPGLACDCGHVHAASPALASGPLDWRKAWTTVVAVGMRPCTGALIVLVFALSQGLLWAGVAATFAMALGTGLTVAALTLLAVSARGLAVRLGGSGSATAERVHHTIEGVGALVVLAFGVLMLGAALA